MPRLLLADPAQSAPRPSATPAAFGALEGQAMDATGRVTQALGQVINEYVETDARARSVRYEQALQSEANVIALDPDIPGRMGKFEEAQKRLHGQFKPKLGGGSTYDSRAELATMDLHGRFAAATMADGIKQMQANNALERDHWASKAAHAETEAEALSYLATAKESLEAGSLYLSPAEKTIAEQETLAKTIQLTATQNPELAEQLMHRFGESLPPETQTQLRGSISTEARYVEAQRISDLAIDTLGPDATQSDYMRFARQHAEGQVRSEAEGRLRLHANEQKAGKLEAKNHVVEGAWDRIYAGGGLDAIPRGLEHEDEGPMRSWIDARAKAAGEGKAFNPETDETTWSMLWKIREKDPETFKGLNLPAYRMKLSNTHFSELEADQKSLKSGGIGEQTSPSGMGALEITNKLAKQAGLDTDQATALQMRAHDAMKVQRAELGRELTFDEKETTAREVLREIEVPDAGFMFFDGTKRMGDLTAADRTAILENPPADLQARTRKELAARGVTITGDDDITQAIDDYLDANGVPRE